ncbi:DUF3592 domain-containing protein [Nocardioides bruguierae]|uniref:DUF3592 domain-containing protein n=1 Tax=Nocardioides bruguierae TaxID=2945102 RepID=A0A9X2IFG5_9ACTN|nr:DUF3592 domain-containing protein [Nocardioides bruguierae]MCM0621292.1 DUF3592 domain-containing protein [Nocardioides bruguierae]
MGLSGVDVVVLVAAVLMLGAAARLAVRAGRQRAEAADFESRAVPAEGEVLQTRAKDVSLAGEPTTVYFHLVQWRLPDGGLVRAETLSGTTPPVPRVGERVALRYDRLRTDQVVLAAADPRLGAGGTAWALARLLAAVGLAVPLAWLVVRVVVATL